MSKIGFNLTSVQLIYLHYARDLATTGPVGLFVFGFTLDDLSATQICFLAEELGLSRSNLSKGEKDASDLKEITILAKYN